MNKKDSKDAPGVRHRVTVTMNAEMLKELQHTATEKETTVSEIIRSALVDYLKG